jgi:uncharacterized protein (TIGR03437 family)
VGLSDAINMAKIMSPNFGDPGVRSNPAIGNNYNSTTFTDMGAHHYRFIGIEFATGLTSYNYHVILFAPPNKGVPFSSATMPHDIIIDRCLLHGNDPLATTFPDGTALLNGSAVFDVANGAVVDSKLYNLWGVGTETQAFWCGGGPGPRLIQNNEISGGTEGFLCGGSLLPYNDRIPTDITVVHNYFNRPAAWQTSTPIVPTVKNLFELKVGKRVRLTDNLFENNWDRGGGQNGYAITLTPRPYQDSGYGAVPAILSSNEVSDVVVANNVVRKVGGFVATGLLDSDCAASSVTCVQSARHLISDNMADYDTAYFPTPYGGISAARMQDWSVKRNTLLGHTTAGGTAPPALFANRYVCTDAFGTNFEWSNNINLTGTQGSCSYDPANILVASWLGTVSVTSNLVTNVFAPVSTSWSSFGHATQMAATEADIKLNADELTLQASSPYFGMGIGANLSCFNEAAVRAGTPSALCPLPPEVQAGTTVAITSPTSSPTFTTSNSTVNLSGTAFDSAGITQVSWATDHGASGFATGTANWTINGLVLPTGSTRVTVTARNTVAAQASATIALTYAPDTIAPTIAITSPTSGPSFSTSSSTISLGGTSSDNVGVTQVTWATDHGASGTASGTANWTISGVAVPAGSTQITVTAADAAGNVATAVLAVTSTATGPSDTTPPAISITSPTSSSSFTATGSTISLSGTASDNVGVAQVTWATDHGASGTASGTNNWSISGLTLATGSTQITVTAVDAAGNAASRFLAVTYSAPDTAPPSIIITSPTSATTFTTSGTSVSVGGIASDNIGVTQITWATDRGGSGVATGTSSWNTGSITLQSGSTQITVTAYDRAGNTSSAVLAVTTPQQTDTTPPTVSITSPTAASTFSTSSTSINLSGTASDNVGVTQVIWVTDRGSNGVAAGTASWSASAIPLQSGSNQITVTARDAAGNQKSAVIAVTSTATTPSSNAPTVVITSPTSGPAYTTSVDSINLAGTASDTNGIVAVTWSGDRGNGSGSASGTSSWSVNQIKLKNGSNTITITARDAANVLGSQVILVTYSPPTVNTRKLPKAQAGVPYAYSLDVSGGVPPYSWSASSLPAGLSLSTDGLISGTPSTTGSYDVTFAVQDSAVSANATLTLSVNPWIELVSPATFSAGWAAPQSMLTALGWQLSSGTAWATDSLPTVLADCTVTVRDAQGTDRLAPLYFVSPNQINFVIPAETSLGPATITVANSGRFVISGTAYVASVAPSLFEANADNLAAGNLLRVRGDVSEYDPISQVESGTNQVVAVPIDLSPDTDRFYLILYGSGIRLRSSLDSVRATVGGMDAIVVYAGSAGAGDGLDLVSVLLPTQLHGWADVVITVDGVTANTVRVLIK